MKNPNLKMSETHNQTFTEGPIAKAIEQRTARLPSDTFLWLALGSIGASATFQMLGKKETSNFVGQWAPTFLILGLYNKLVKVMGSDKQERLEEEVHKEEAGKEDSFSMSA